MMIDTPAELSHLPAPELIEELSYDRLLETAIDRLKIEFQHANVAFDVSKLEANPARIIMRESAYKELNLRQRINDAMRSVLLAFARGSDLDNFVAHKTTRMDAEDDQRLVTRYLLLMQGSSTGGTAERYEAEAMGADVAVSQAFCYTVGKSPIVYVSITDESAGGIAAASLVEKVQTRLEQRSIRLVGDRIIVLAAVRQIVDVSARVWISERSSTLIIDQLPLILKTAWSKRQRLGLDLTLSYLTSQLMAEGVHNIELDAPQVDIIAGEHEAIAIGDVSIQYMGKDH